MNIRDFELKAWDKVNKKMIDVDYLRISGLWDENMFYSGSNGEKIIHKEDSRLIFLETIGLEEAGPKDLRAERIFLGDILVVDSEDGIFLCEVVENIGEKAVEAVVGGYLFRNIRELDIDCSSDNEEEWEGKDLEQFKEYIGDFHFIRVVGNRYENPELLENMEK